MWHLRETQIVRSACKCLQPLFPLLSQACFAHSGYITSCATTSATKHILNCHNSDRCSNHINETAASTTIISKPTTMYHTSTSDNQQRCSNANVKNITYNKIIYESGESERNSMVYGFIANATAMAHRRTTTILPLLRYYLYNPPARRYN